MQVNIDKILSEYKGFFADNSKSGVTDTKNTFKEYAAVNFGSDRLEKNSGLGQVYDKNSKLTEMETGIDKGNKTMSDSALSFLNDAIDTLKNLVTDEDYSKMSELGITADKEEIGTIVTVYERIQIQLAAYGGKDISSLDISGKKIDMVIKSKSLANGVKMAESVGKINDSAKEYLLKNNMEPTVENVYMAVHSNENSQNEVQVKMDKDQWEQLKSQVEKFMEKNGIEADNRAVDSAKWLLERDIPLTVDNLVKYMKLQDIENPSDRNTESIKANMVLAEIFNSGAENGYMTEGWIDAKKAEDVVSTIRNAGNDAVEYIVRNRLTLNAANIKRYLEEAPGKDKAAMEEGFYSKEEGYDRQLAKAKQIIEEAKAVMTMEGAVLMEKLGVDITYTEIEYIVNAVKEENTKFYSAFLTQPDTSKADILANVMSIMGEVKKLPVAAVGGAAYSEKNFDMQNVYDEGIRLKQAYEKAGTAYETLGTEVRTDLGDSLKKAFGNIDQIIQDTGLTADRDTRRAVRILGYNSMPITRESIVFIAEKASEVDRAIKNITPKTAAYLIENGINPLKEDIEDLNDRLLKINSEIGAEENEEYAKYLWKLEKSGNFTEEKRQAYIELYRALKTIEKADTRAIGAVTAEGAALTLGNLLTAEKSRSKYGMNVTINENTGYYEGRLIKNKLADILENITNKNHGENPTVAGLEEIYLTPENIAESRRLGSLYEEYMAEDIKSIIDKASKENSVRFTEKMMVDFLDGKITYTTANIAAEAMLMTNGGEIRRMLKNTLDSENVILDRFEDHEEVLEGYEELNRQAEEQYREGLDAGQEDCLKYRRLAQVTAFMAKSAQNKCYHIPVDINGESVMVKVRFANSGGKEESKVEIELDNEILGSINGEFTVKSDTVWGIIRCKNNEICNHISQNMKVFSEMLGRKADIAVVPAEDITVQSTGDGDNSGSTARELYDTAKTFLKALKIWAEMPITNIVN